MSALTPGSAANSLVADGQLARPTVDAIDRLSKSDLNRLAGLLKQRPPREAVPIRTIHHFACTGGTLIAKGLQSQPNTLLLSEMDPLSTIQLTTQRSRFAPTDPILLARSALSPISDITAVEMFVAAMKVLHDRMNGIGRRLILRDHAHSQFCTDVDWRQRPSLADMLTEVAPLRSIVTVRHPIDSFLALDRNQWCHFSPPTLDEYARRYLAFLSTYENVPIVRYETFVSDPDETMRGICKQLDLPYNSDWKALISVMRLSGDSGRRGNKIAPRVRREYSEELVQEAQMSTSYQELCVRLGYDAEIDRFGGGAEG
ncbi:sulfotransferase [Maricaulis sp.]|uniref:sulfotransferase n=1 Tax=Maricaulis sp. TaxID=1486257 RepID=UPI0026192A07|nr:sulfotransferase [Maricaulis sp.]